MLDIKLIRENPEIVKKDLKKRNDTEKIKWVDSIIKKDEEYRKLLTESQKLRQRRNEVTEEINQLKKHGKDIKAKIKEVKEIPDKIRKAEEKIDVLKKEITAYLMKLPNILDDDVPVGKDESDNKIIRAYGKKPDFGFKPKDQVDIITNLGLADIERAAKISGARFYFMKNELVLLEQALINLALDMLKQKGFTIIEPPFMIRRKAYGGVTDLSDFEGVIYKVEGEDLYLIATSEHPICAMYMDEVIDAEKLPIKLAGISPCFRKEAGSHGKDTKGIFRVHQFNKVEQFAFCKPEQSNKIFEEFIKNAEEIFKRLELPYRIVSMCTADIGTVAAKKYDLEVWMPSQNKYREVVSCSNCTDYQARRLNIKYTDGTKKELVHTVNSTAVATTRALVAIVENFQQKDGSVKIPKALQKYTGIKDISKKDS